MKLTRRDFIKFIAAAIAGAVVGAVRVEAEVEKPESFADVIWEATQVPPDKKVKFERIPDYNYGVSPLTALPRTETKPFIVQGIGPASFQFQVGDGEWFDISPENPFVAFSRAAVAPDCEVSVGLMEGERGGVERGEQAFIFTEIEWDGDCDGAEYLRKWQERINDLAKG